MPDAPKPGRHAGPCPSGRTLDTCPVAGDLRHAITLRVYATITRVRLELLELEQLLARLDAADAAPLTTAASLEASPPSQPPPDAPCT